MSQTFKPVSEGLAEEMFVTAGVKGRREENLAQERLTHYFSLKSGYEVPLSPVSQTSVSYGDTCTLVGCY